MQAFSFQAILQPLSDLLDAGPTEHISIALDAPAITPNPTLAAASQSLLEPRGSDAMGHGTLSATPPLLTFSPTFQPLTRAFITASCSRRRLSSSTTAFPFRLCKLQAVGHMAPGHHQAVPPHSPGRARPDAERQVRRPGSTRLLVSCCAW